MTHPAANGGDGQAELVAGPRGSGLNRVATDTLEDNDQLELISCDGCGRFFLTLDGPGMIAAIKGPCPDCGGRFELNGPDS